VVEGLFHAGEFVSIGRLVASPGFGDPRREAEHSHALIVTSGARKVTRLRACARLVAAVSQRRYAPVVAREMDSRSWVGKVESGATWCWRKRSRVAKLTYAMRRNEMRKRRERCDSERSEI
ncbi:hypothetical protein O988_09867, partial [Pseudogymnoascus sp. VKM F-3808]